MCQGTEVTVQFGPICRTEIIAIVQCMYADYVVWGDELSGLVDDFLTVRWDPSKGRGKFVLGGESDNAMYIGLTYKKNVALRNGRSMHAAE